MVVMVIIDFSSEQFLTLSATVTENMKIFLVIAVLCLTILGQAGGAPGQHLQTEDGGDNSEGGDEMPAVGARGMMTGGKHGKYPGKYGGKPGHGKPGKYGMPAVGARGMMTGGKHGKYPGKYGGKPGHVKPGKYGMPAVGA